LKPLRKNPDDALAHNNLGYAYGSLGNHKKAIESYKQAIRINPDYTKVHYNIGLAYIILNDKGYLSNISSFIIRKYCSISYYSINLIRRIHMRNLKG
jgi:tetratricopeptide (TPR) repeat protein